MTKRVGFQIDYRQYLIKKEKTLEDKAQFFELEFVTNTFYLYIKDAKFELLDTSKHVISTGLVSSIKSLAEKDDTLQ